MEQKEKIKVFILFDGGKTSCICSRSRRKCNNPECKPDVVLRDKFYGWRDTMSQDKYGK